MNDGAYIILGLVVFAHVAWIAIKAWTRKRDRAYYRELFRDIRQDHAKPERKRLIGQTMADFDERCDFVTFGFRCRQVKGHSGMHVISHRDATPTEKICFPKNNEPS